MQVSFGNKGYCNYFSDTSLTVDTASARAVSSVKMSNVNIDC